MNAVPKVRDDQFAAPGHFNQVSEAVNAYWKMHLTDKGNDLPAGNPVVKKN
jgi:hypothetical protein